MELIHTEPKLEVSDLPPRASNLTQAELESVFGGMCGPSLSPYQRSIQFSPFGEYWWGKNSLIQPIRDSGLHKNVVWTPDKTPRINKELSMMPNYMYY